MELPSGKKYIRVTPDPSGRKNIPKSAAGVVAAATAVGRCSFTPASPQVHRAWFQRLNMKYDEQLSNFAFICKLCPFAAAAVGFALGRGMGGSFGEVS